MAGASASRRQAMEKQCKVRSGNIDSGCPCNLIFECHVPPAELLEEWRQQADELEAQGKLAAAEYLRARIARVAGTDAPAAPSLAFDCS